MLLAIDPGQTSGWALFTPKGGLLLGCGLGSPEKFRWYVASALSKVVIEKPVIYPGGRTKNPNDVLSVAVNAGEWGGRYLQQGTTVEYVTPAGWKGQTPKDVSHARIYGKLTDEEKAVLDTAGGGLAASKRHNMLDAVGIGLWAVKR